MSLLSFAILVIPLTLTIPCVNSDDTSALRNTLSLLCSSNNNEGKFSSCCSISLNGASVTLNDEGCLSKYFTADDTESSLIELFVFHSSYPSPFHFCFILFSFNSHFEDAGLTTLPSNCFSSLTNLNTLSPHALTTLLLHFPHLSSSSSLFQQHQITSTRTL